jgi:hypothetical protein
LWVCIYQIRMYQCMYASPPWMLYGFLCGYLFTKYVIYLLPTYVVFASFSSVFTCY